MKDIEMQELVGREIHGLSVSEEAWYLSFETDQGAIAYMAEGDCCSESWFADIVGVDALIGGTVRTVDEVSTDSLPAYNVEDGRSRQDYDDVYGYKITTDRGHADIIFRNSSNGYYGGWLELFAGELPVMKPITADWLAETHPPYEAPGD